MSILAIVPARGGSKGIPYKNIIDINGHPLIYYVLKELLKTKRISDIIVSTDDIKIKNTVSKIFENKIIIMNRPAEISTDRASSESVIKYVLENIDKSYEYTMLVQCTSPLTEYSDFNNLINVVISGFDCVAFCVEEYSYYFDIGADLNNMKRQRLPRQLKHPRRREAGNAWIFKTSEFLKYNSRIFGNLGTTLGLCKIDQPKQIEIDRPRDVELCGHLLKLRNNNE